MRGGGDACLPPSPFACLASCVAPSGLSGNEGAGLTERPLLASFPSSLALSLLSLACPLLLLFLYLIIYNNNKAVESAENH